MRGGADGPAPATGSAKDTAGTSTIEGTVTGWDGNPMAGLEMFLVLADEPAPPRMKGGKWRIRETKAPAETDESGYYSARSPWKDWTGVVVARVSSTYEVRSAPIRVDGTRQRVDFVLPPPATLRVRLVSHAGERPRLRQLDVNGEFVWFGQNRSEEDAWRVREEEEGRIAWIEATPGHVKVQAWIENGPMVEQEVDLVAGQVADVQVLVPGDGVVVGRIIDPGNRELRHASVTWEGDRHVSGEADENGRFRLFGVGRSPGTIHVHAFVGEVGMLDTSRAGVEPDGEPVELVLKLQARVVLRLEGVTAGEPITTALLSRTRTGVSRREQPADGRLEFHPHPGEPTLLVLIDPSFAPIVVDLPTLREGLEHDLGTARFVAGLDVRGRVRDGSGAAVPDVEVTVAERWSSTTGRADAAGSFLLPRMPARPFLLRVRGGKFPQHLIAVDPVATPAPDIVVTLGGLADVSVVDATGDGVAGATVTAFPVGEFPYDADFDKTRRSLDVDSKGKRQTRLCAGPHRLRARSDDGRESDDMAITVKEGETTEVTLVLRGKPAK